MSTDWKVSNKYYIKRSKVHSVGIPKCGVLFDPNFLILIVKLILWLFGRSHSLLCWPLPLSQYGLIKFSCRKYSVADFHIGTLFFYYILTYMPRLPGYRDLGHKYFPQHLAHDNQSLPVGILSVLGFVVELCYV